MPPSREIPVTAPRLPASEIRVGITRQLGLMGFATLSEFELGNHRRIDLAAINRKGVIAFVEIKSSINDFRSDEKWPLYLDYCDLFYFGVAPGFPLALLNQKSSLPERSGVFIADRFGAEIIREAAEVPIHAGRRKSETLRFARRAAARLQQAEVAI